MFFYCQVSVSVSACNIRILVGNSILLSISGLLFFFLDCALRLFGALHFCIFMTQRFYTLRPMKIDVLGLFN